MGVILLGDKTAAARWLSYAKSRAAALARQGKNLSQTFSPVEGVTIRVQTLQGTPRVWIEAGGMDYVMATDRPVEGGVARTTILGGTIRSGAARPVGFTEFGTSNGLLLRPLGDDVFLASPTAQGFAGNAAIIYAKRSTATGTGFNPWQDPAYDVFATTKVFHSGVTEDGFARLHVMYAYYRSAPYTGAPNNTIEHPAIATSFDGGASFSTTVFTINVTPPGAVPSGALEDIYIRSAVFCGNNKIALVGIAQWGATNSICSLTSSNGGASWAFNLAPQTEGVFTSQLTCAHIGGDKILGVTTNPGSGIGARKTYLSTDAGVSFTLVEDSVDIININLSELVCLAPDSALYIRNDIVFRTVDAGATWEAIAGAVNGQPVIGNDGFLGTAPVVIAVPSVPDPLPAGKYPADYTTLATRCALPDSPQTTRIGISRDGGRTWKSGGIIPGDGFSIGNNIGVINKKLPPFPIFPDLHKNGLDIP
jgi:hypothetical protein